MHYIYKNLLINPSDPDYDPRFAPEDDYETFEQSCIEREEFRRENN